MNFSLNALAKNLPDNGFNYLSQKFSSEQLELVKQKGVYPDKYIGSFKFFFEDKLPEGVSFIVP